MSEPGPTSGDDPIPAIAERAATGATADVFADIRATLGIGNVNLIWRHLATLDGALEWAWAAARPLYASGAAMRAAGELPGALAGIGTLASVRPWSCERCAAAGIDPAARETIAAVLETYNRGNGLNLVALSALQAAGEHENGRAAPAAARPVAAASVPAEAGPARLPPLPELDAMAPEVRASVLALNRLAVEHPADVAVASLYKHLAIWPGLLVLARETLLPLDADGTLVAAARSLRASARDLAGGLAASLGPAPPGPPGERVRDALPAFTEGAICRMIPVGLVLRATIAGAPAPAAD